MKIYMAGGYSMGLHGYLSNPAYIDREIYKRHYKSVPILESYHYIQNEKIFPSVRKNKDSIFLDSGAFSMFTQGIEVNLQAYADFIRKNSKLIHIASNLDVIGKGNEKATYKNQKTLESMGAKIAPVHHARDKDKWLERYLNDGYEDIFLGGMVPESAVYLKEWLDRVWDRYLTDKNGHPLVRVHGFGLTTESLMTRYPWYSVDSTKWAIAAGMGSILVPLNRPDRFFWQITFSSQSPARKKRNQHILTISEDERRLVNKFVRDFGFKPKQLRNSAAVRRMFNLLAFREMQHNYPWPKTFSNSHRGLF
jgi:hypothetical protein